MNDLRFAFRQLRKHPGFAAIAIATLAVGIGVNTTMFSILDAVMLRGLPSPEEHRLLAFYYTPLGGNSDERQGVSKLEFDELRDRQQSFVSLAAFEDRTTTICPPGGDPERISGTTISAMGPAMLHMPLAFGRWFNADEDQPGAAGTILVTPRVRPGRSQNDSGGLWEKSKGNKEMGGGMRGAAGD